MAHPRSPSFRYHPDPLDTGSAVRSEQPCSVCGVARGLIYDGPIYGRQVDVLCLECISTGQAARVLSLHGRPASFTDVGWGVPEDVPSAVLEEVAERTPGFRGWQQEHWLYHCGDAAAYLGKAGYERLTSFPDALEMVLHENDELGWTEQQAREYVESLAPDAHATAYLFRCLRCDRALAYTDMS